MRLNRRRARPFRAWGLAIATALAASVPACARTATPRAPTSLRTVGILRAVRSSEPQNIDVFLATLSQAGFVVGKSLRILGGDPAEVRPDPGEAESTVRAWAAQGLDLVVALSSGGAMAAARGAPDVAVLFLSNDPTAAGLVADERRPDGRLTGATFRVPADRTLELARRSLPGLAKVGLLYPSTDPAAGPVRDAMVRAGSALGIEVDLGGCSAASDVAAVVEELRGRGVGTVVLANAPSTVRAYPPIAAAPATATLAAIANTSADFALITLEPDTRALYAQMGRQAVRILQGTPLSQIPVEDPGRFRLTVNLAVAARLGLTVPAEVVRTADTVVRP